MHRLAIDVTSTITGRTGIARYVAEVADGMAAAEGAPEIARVAFGRALEPVPPATRHVRVPLRVLDWAWRATGQPRFERFTGPFDTLHASGPILPPARAPIVGVVHDLAPLDHPELHPARDVAQLQRYLDGLGLVAAVITVSQATADRLAAIVPNARVHVVPNGRSRFPDPVAAPLTGRPYVLAVGAPVPRKGYDALLRAMARLDDPDLALAIIGPPGSEDTALAALAADLGLTDRVHRAGPVSDAELAGWYKDASVLAAPSIEEGFGLPLVEALDAGVPVVASDIAAFREVTGSHASLVPVGDVDALADAVAAASAWTPAVRSEVQLGRRHVARYTWQACAAATLAVHREVAG